MGAKDVTKNLSFDYMWKNNVVAHVNVYSNGKINCETIGKGFFDNPLPLGTDGNKLYDFFESRCFPKTRGNADELLRLLGLSSYNPLAIVRKTRGQQFDDFYWIRFEGDTVDYEDIKLR